MRIATLVCTYVAVSACITLAKSEVDHQVEIDTKLCTTEDNCDTVLDKYNTDEETKYWVENGQDLHIGLHVQTDDHHDKTLGNVNENEGGIVDNQNEQKSPEVFTHSSDTTVGEKMVQNSVVDKVAPNEPPSLYEYPPLTRIDPVKVGYEAQIELDGKFYTRVTKALQPPVFEVLDFLSAEECDQFIEAGRQLGLETSGLFGAEIAEEKKKEDNSEITRISDQTWLRPNNLPGLWESLMKRLAGALEMPVEFVQRSEPIQLVKYEPGGHYHAHIDTTDTRTAGTSELPCCVQTHCGSKENTAQWSQCCRLCRYMTVMYYLSDVEEGGETAFPLADMEDNLYKEKTTNMGTQRWYNLSKYCYNSSLVVTPRKGSAIIWYSHFRDEETNYLGLSDYRSYHGGCDLIKGTKWIANNFISAVPYRDRFKPSVWFTG